MPKEARQFLEREASSSLTFRCHKRLGSLHYVLDSYYSPSCLPRASGSSFVFAAFVLASQVIHNNSIISITAC